MKSRILRYFLIVGMLLGFNLSFSASLKSANLKSINPHENDKPHCKGKKCKMSTVKTSMTSPDIQPVRDASKDYEKKANELEEETSLDNFDSSVTQESFLDESGESFFHQIPMLSNLADEMKINTGDDIREAFISREETDDKRPAKLKEISKLEQYCNHRAKFSTWLTCDKIKGSGEYNIKGGTFGVALFGSIQNDGKHGIEVYSNCRIKPEGEYWDVKCSEENLVPTSEEPIPIVIKITNSKEETKHTELWGDKQTLLEKEIRRTKAASKFRFGPGLKILPDIYDIKIKKTGQVHPIHKEAYIQYQIQGKTANRVIRDFIADERHSMYLHQKKMFYSFHQLLNEAFRQKQGDTSARVIWHKLLFNEAVTNAIKEMWLRGRLRVTDISFIMINALSMWGLMIHCDSYGNNIMMVRHIIKTEEELKRGKEDANTIISSHNVEYSETSKTSDIEKQELKRGISAYSFLPDRIKWIDASRALPILPILREIRKEKPEESDPAKFLIGGCELYRELSRADFAELHRVGIHTAFGGTDEENKPSTNNHKALFNMAREELKKDKKLKQIFRVMDKFFNDYRAGKLDETKIASLHQKELWKEFFPALLKYEKENEKIHKIFLDLLKNIETLPETKACYKSHDDACAKRDEAIAIGSGDMAWSLASKVIDGGCSLADMREGAKKVQRLIKQAASQFPDFATPITFGTSDT